MNSFGSTEKLLAGRRLPVKLEVCPDLRYVDQMSQDVGGKAFTNLMDRLAQLLGVQRDTHTKSHARPEQDVVG